MKTRNTLDSDQSNYSSRIVFSHIPIAFSETGNSAIRSADLENPAYNKHEVDRTTPRGDGHLKFSQVRGRSSVGPQYRPILLLTLISYTHLRYVRNVAREG